ncbi:MAG: hypothetical protein AAFO96_03705 [Bacteroidota bacterium]
MSVRFNIYVEDGVEVTPHPSEGNDLQELLKNFQGNDYHHFVCEWDVGSLVADGLSPELIASVRVFRVEEGMQDLSEFEHE